MVRETEDGAGHWVWPLAFIGYFAFQAAYRWMLGGGLGLDESQMILWGQRLAWGYGPQPPLYSWIQWLAFRIIPDPLLALSLVKNALLCTTYLAIYFLLRTAHSPGRAGLATAALLLVPQIAWESQRALTHSVLATTLAALAYLAFWRLFLAGRKRGPAVFGTICGLGLIAKANFCLVPLALLAAAASLPDLRGRLRPKALAIAAGIALLIAAGPFVWILRNQEAALHSAYKLDMAGGDAWGPLAMLQGIGATLQASALFLALPLLVALLIRWRRGSDAPAPVAPELDRFLARVVIAGLVLTLIVVLFTATTRVKDRWMQPTLFFAAPLIALWLLARVNASGRAWYRGTVFACATLVTLVLPIPTVTGLPGDPSRGGAPIDRLISDLLGAYPDAVHVIGDPEWIAGNLAYRHPPWQVEAANSAVLAPGSQALLVWIDAEAEGGEIARQIGAQSGGTVAIGETARFEAPYPWQPDLTFEIFAAPLARGP